MAPMVGTPAIEMKRNQMSTHSQIWRRFLVKCTRTETEDDESVEGKDAERVEGRLD
jgi:hypothetical protein